ncbi:SRPBCC family protein [Sphingomonas sp. CJ20]
MSELRDDAPPYVSKDSDVQASAAPGGEGTVWGRTVSIMRPREELYAFWRDFGNLATFMENIVSIDAIDDRRSRWTVKGPNGEYSWTSVVTDERPGELIEWQSEDGDVKNSGRIEFRDGPPGHGTYVRAILAYDPPGGFIGKAIAKLTQKEPQISSTRDLRRFKQLMETGEIATTSPPNRASDS